jgi:hypothetical protein
MKEGWSERRKIDYVRKTDKQKNRMTDRKRIKSRDRRSGLNPH